MLVVLGTCMEDEVIPCGLDDGGDGPGRDRNPANSAKEQRDYLKDPNYPGWLVYSFGCLQRGSLNYSSLP